MSRHTRDKHATNLVCLLVKVAHLLNVAKIITRLNELGQGFLNVNGSTLWSRLSNSVHKTVWHHHVANTNTRYKRLSKGANVDNICPFTLQLSR